VRKRRGDDLVRRVGYYGPRDDRRDPFVTPGLPAPLLAHARRTCSIVGASAIARAPDGVARLQAQVYGSFNALCRDEPFWDQPAVMERRLERLGDFGYTGYLLGPDTVLTCWHGWEQMAHEPQFAVFGYALRPDGASPLDRPADCVYEISPYPLARPPGDDDASPCEGDWVVLRLERPVAPGAVAATLAAPAFAPARRGRAVYTLGYPRGLPLKLADAAHVRELGAGTFRADLDTYVGNSGSPVFDAASHALVGIVVEAQKGEGDFVASPALGCYVSNRIDRDVAGALAVAAACFAEAATRAARAR
jgi:V8-like Glu-specific endopeptidase